MKKIIDWLRSGKKSMTAEEKEHAVKRRMKTFTKTQNLGVLPPEDKASGPPKKPEKGD